MFKIILMCHTINPYKKHAMFVVHSDSDTNFQTLEDCYTIYFKTHNFVSNVNLWHPTKKKRKNDYESEVVICTSIYKFSKIQKNWHTTLILDLS